MATSAFGDFLRFYRLRQVMTQELLAERTGISVRALSDMERGRALSPQRRTIDLLVRGLGLHGEEADEFVALARSGRRPAAAGDRSRTAPPFAAGSTCALPPVLADLIGRTAEQQTLRRLAVEAGASSHLQVAVLHGAPGTGKTALAVHAGHTLVHHFANGCLFLDLRGLHTEPLTPHAAVQRLLRGFGVDERQVPADAGDRFALYRSLLRDRAVLLVLDNVADESQVLPLLAASPGSMAVVTSRNTLAGLDARRRVPVGLLGLDHSVRLLTLVVGERRVAAEPEPTRTLAALCGGVPLALLIAGNRLASRPQWSIAHLADQLDDERRRLSMLTAGDLQVRAAFEMSYLHLSASAAAMFRRLALVSGLDTSVELAATAAGLPVEQAAESLRELVDASLLDFSETSGRYTRQDLLRVFAAERMTIDESDPEVDEATRRTQHWLLAVATKAASLFEHDSTPATVRVPGPDPVTDRPSAAMWLELELENWRGALRCAVDRGDHRRVLALAQAMHWYSDLRGTGSLWCEVFTAGAQAARAVGDPLAEAQQLNYTAWALYALSERLPEAVVVHHRAIEAAEAVGDTTVQAWTTYYGAAIRRRLGEPHESVRLCRDAVEKFEQARYPTGRFLALAMLGTLLYRAGELDEAVAVLEQSVAHYRTTASEPGNEELLSMVLTRLAEVRTATGEVDQALTLLDEAESMFRRHDTALGVARVWYLRGLTLIRADRYVDARRELERARDAARTSDVKIEVLSRLGDLAEKCGEPARAREHRVRALAECGRFDTPGVRAVAARLSTTLGVSASELD